MEWIKLLNRPEPSSKDLSDVISGISQILFSEKFYVLDSCFSVSEPENMSMVMQLALLRTSFSVRVFLPNWEVFLNKAYIVAKKNGKEPERQFKGLIRK